MVSGPGAEEGEDLDRALVISSQVTAGTSAKTGHHVLHGWGASAGKKWRSRASLTSSGVLTPGNDGNLGTWCPAAMRLAFQTVRWSVLRRKSPQCLFLALFTSLKYAVLAIRISVIARRLSLWIYVFKPVSWLAGDSRLRQTLILRIHLVELRSFSSNLSFNYYLLTRAPL